VAFALLSLALLPYPGLQDDELFFTVPLYLPQGTLFSVKAFGGRVPLMLNGYLGAFKTWLYAGIFEFFEPSRWSVRVPMVLVGVITIWLTWLWTRRAAGPRAAAFTVALLATDSVFIVTNTFDWGPVALQHALLMGGLVALQTWLAKDSSRYLALSFLLFGLGLWDKALMIWPLVGLAVATLCVYPKELRQHLRRVPLAIAAASLLLGALPLVTFNLIRHGETASANTKLSLFLIPAKLNELRQILNGSILLGPLVATSAGPLEQTPKTLVERTSAGIETALGARPENWMLPALALSVVCLIFL
jgi:4-amino-4-deoxy-L-arabinose transferase-like glycosyltransferase